jgi:hypothetical protein
MHSTGMSEVSRLAHPGFGVSGWIEYGTSTQMATLDAAADDLELYSAAGNRR